MLATLATQPSEDITQVLLATIARRLTPQPIKLRADIELTCYTPVGIDAIKRALFSGESQGSETVPIKAKLVAPPLYVLSTNATDKVRLLRAQHFIYYSRLHLLFAFFLSTPLWNGWNVQSKQYRLQSSHREEDWSSK